MKLIQRKECYFGLDSQQPVANKMFDYLKKKLTTHFQPSTSTILIY